MQLRHRLFRNSISSLLQLGVTTILGLVLPPLLLQYLGLEAYGIWSLIILVNAYVALLDLGFGSSLIKYVAEADATGDKKQIGELINGCLTIYIGIYLASLALVLLLGRLFMHALLGDSAQKGDFLLLFEGYAFVALTGLLTVPFSSLLKGIQRQDQSNAVETVGMVVGTILSILLIIGGWKLEALVIGAAIATLLRLFTYLWLSRKNYNVFQFRWNGYQSLKRTIRRLVRLSAADNSVRVYNVVTQTVIRVSINLFAGVAYVGVYDLAKRVVSQISGISSVVFIPLMPAVSSLAAQKRYESLRELLGRCHLYLSMIGLPFFYFLLIFFDPILSAWLKIDNVASISFAGRVLLIATTIDIFTGPATTSALGLGTARLHLIKMLLSGMLSVLLVLLLARVLGFAGILIAELCAAATGAIVGFWLFQRWFQIPVIRMILSSLWRTSLVALPVWLVLGCGWFLLRQNAVWQSLVSWALLLLVGGACTIALYWACGLLSSYEVDLVRNALLPSSARMESLSREAAESS